MLCGPSGWCCAVEQPEAGGWSLEPDWIPDSHGDARGRDGRSRSSRWPFVKEDVACCRCFDDAGREKQTARIEARRRRAGKGRRSDRCGICQPGVCHVRADGGHNSSATRATLAMCSRVQHAWRQNGQSNSKNGQSKVAVKRMQTSNRAEEANKGEHEGRGESPLRCPQACARAQWRPLA